MKNKPGRKRTPSYAKAPTTGSPRAINDPASFDNKEPAWQFAICDKEHKWWGWNKVDSEKLSKMLLSLCSLEGMKWNDLV